MKREKNKFKILTKEEIESHFHNRKWKEENHKYLKELQSFFDKIEKIGDMDLKDNVLNQMLQCDKALTEIAEEMFMKFYKFGYEQAKKE